MNAKNFFSQKPLGIKFPKVKSIDSLDVGDRVEWTRNGEWRQGIVKECGIPPFKNYSTAEVQMEFIDERPASSIVVVRINDLVLINNK